MNLGSNRPLDTQDIQNLVELENSKNIFSVKFKNSYERKRFFLIQGQPVIFKPRAQLTQFVSDLFLKSIGQVNNVKQYTNKENMGDIQMRSTSGGPTAT